jgi:hypothetical protein
MTASGRSAGVAFGWIDAWKFNRRSGGQEFFF